MEIGRLHADPCIDQHLRRFDAVGLYRHSGRDRADTGKHLAADLPGVVPSTPRIRHLGAGKAPADGIDHVATHGFPLMASPSLRLRASAVSERPRPRPQRAPNFSAITAAALGSPACVSRHIGGAEEICPLGLNAIGPSGYPLGLRAN